VLRSDSVTKELEYANEIYESECRSLRGHGAQIVFLTVLIIVIIIYKVNYGFR